MPFGYDFVFGLLHFFNNDQLVGTCNNLFIEVKYFHKYVN